MTWSRPGMLCAALGPLRGDITPGRILGSEQQSVPSAEGSGPSHSWVDSSVLPEALKYRPYLQQPQCCWLCPQQTFLGLSEQQRNPNTLRDSSLSPR